MRRYYYTFDPVYIECRCYRFNYPVISSSTSIVVLVAGMRQYYYTFDLVYVRAPAGRRKLGPLVL
jgi:hypothetical protein